MLKCYALNECHEEVIFLFRIMRNTGVGPNCFTFPIVLGSSKMVGELIKSEELHSCVIKSGFGPNPYVVTSLIHLYSSHRIIHSAHKVYLEIRGNHVVACTSLINCYLSSRNVITARFLFESVPERDTVMWNTIIVGYIKVGDMGTAQDLFDKMPNKDIMSWNTILSGYGCNGDVEGFERVFEEMPERNVFSWNGLIGGYARNDCLTEVLNAFKRMLTIGNVTPNVATLVIVLSVCARLGALGSGKCVHGLVESSGFKVNTNVGNALIDMYAKSGMIENSVRVFGYMDEKDLIGWNTIIGGLATHGQGTDALRLFSQMKDAEIKPDGVTFVGVLSACVHMGLVENGLKHFNSMINNCSIVPQIEHYGCMVDLLARAGLLFQALDFVANMPIQPDSVIWAALLGACRVYKNAYLAELALLKLMEFEPNNPANYVMLANIYGDLRKWTHVAKLKVAMRDTGYKKVPGYSFIDVNGVMVEFYSLDEKLLECKEICETLRGLTKLMKSSHCYLNLVELELKLC